MEMTDVSALRDSIYAEQFQTEYSVKLIKAAQESEQVVGSLIQDTVQISKEAMDKYLQEIKG